MCIDHSTCNTVYNDRCSDRQNGFNYINDRPCANCTDQNQAGCACYRRSEAVEGMSASWYMLESHTPYNASTDICTMSNRTDPTDPDGAPLERGSGPREGKCAEEFGGNSNDQEYTEELPSATCSSRRRR